MMGRKSDIIPPNVYYGVIAYEPAFDDCHMCINSYIGPGGCINLDLDFMPNINAIICNNFEGGRKK